MFYICSSFHHQLLDRVESPSAQAVLAFFDHWNPALAQEHPALVDKLKDVLSGANLVFRYNGMYPQDDPLIRQAWQEYYDAAGEGPEITCLVTGKKSPIAKTHPPILGVGGTNPKLVSFDKESLAFCSYGKEQGYNAPTSEYAAFAYTSALNYLLNAKECREYVRRIGNTAVLFWASGGQRAYQGFSMSYIFGAPATYSVVDLQKMALDLCQGKSVLYDETQLDPNTTFYILGLSPNKGRLSVRFFLKNSFGNFVRNVQAHQERLVIVRPATGKSEEIPPWKLLDATVNQKSNNKSPAPELAGEMLRAILTNTRYPATLLSSITLRMRAECSPSKEDRAQLGFEKSSPVTWVRKAYYLKTPHPDVPKEY